MLLIILLAITVKLFTKQTEPITLELTFSVAVLKFSMTGWFLMLSNIVVGDA
jgi:hypothetical protein